MLQTPIESVALSLMARRTPMCRAISSAPFSKSMSSPHSLPSSGGRTTAPGGIQHTPASDLMHQPDHVLVSCAQLLVSFSGPQLISRPCPRVFGHRAAATGVGATSAFGIDELAAATPTHFSSGCPPPSPEGAAPALDAASAASSGAAPQPEPAGGGRTPNLAIDERVPSSPPTTSTWSTAAAKASAAPTHPGTCWAWLASPAQTAHRFGKP